MIALDAGYALGIIENSLLVKMKETKQMAKIYFIHGEAGMADQNPNVGEPAKEGVGLKLWDEDPDYLPIIRPDVSPDENLGKITLYASQVAASSLPPRDESIERFHEIMRLTSEEIAAIQARGVDLQL